MYVYNSTVTCFLIGAMEIKTDRGRANAWSHLAIGAAIEVHRIKGPGLIESIYSKCFLRECDLRSIPVRRELLVPIEYKGFVFEEPPSARFPCRRHIDLRIQGGRRSSAGP
jgi:PD-(D/E)XK nuclease superfamily protein